MRKIFLGLTSGLGVLSVRRTAKKLIRIAGCVALAMMVPTGTAYADSILTNWNTVQINDAGDYVTVAIGTTSCSATGGTCTTLTVRWHEGSTSDSLQTAIGLDQFFYNTSLFIGILSVSEAGWIVNFDGGQADGFGSFSSKKNENSGGTGGISADIVFTLNGVTTFTANSNGALFAAHVRYGEGCSGYVSDGTATTTESNTNCGVVPEPASLLLLGTGFASLGGILARRRKKGVTA